MGGGRESWEIELWGEGELKGERDKRERGRDTFTFIFSEEIPCIMEKNVRNKHGEELRPTDYDRYSCYPGNIKDNTETHIISTFFSPTRTIDVSTKCLLRNFYFP